jgi:hypothetical protein
MAPTEDVGRGPQNQMNVMWKTNLPLSWFQRRYRAPGLVTTQTTISCVEITWTKRTPAYVVTVHPEWRHSWSMPAGWPHDATPHTCSLHIVQNSNLAVSKTRFAGRTSQLWHRVKPECLVIWSSISSVDGLLPFCLFNVSCLTTSNHRNNTLVGPPMILMHHHANSQSSQTKRNVKQLRALSRFVFLFWFMSWNSGVPVPYTNLFKRRGNSTTTWF